jgi:hypothetical protein
MTDNSFKLIKGTFSVEYILKKRLPYVKWKEGPTKSTTNFSSLVYIMLHAMKIGDEIRKLRENRNVDSQVQALQELYGTTNVHLKPILTLTEDFRKTLRKTQRSGAKKQRSGTKKQKLETDILSAVIKDTIKE